MLKNTSRRNFLATITGIAAVGFPFNDQAIFAAAAPAATVQSNDASTTPVPFHVFTAKELESSAKALQAVPGNKSLVNSKALPFNMVMTTETGKSAREFEWHEGRDHIIQIVDGSTIYEVGGTPKDGHSTRPGEWLAPASEGSESILLGKGDLLVLPRGTPHRRSTADSVTFMLISTT